MTYSASEGSVSDGRPYFLYLFDIGHRVEIGDAAIYFALDVSGSMLGQRLENMISAVETTLSEIQANTTGPIDIRMVAWAASVVSSIERRAIDAQGFADILNWLGTLVISGGTDFGAAVSEAGAFFAGSGTKRRILIFITDGEPYPLSSADNAVVTLAGIPDVEVYCFNLDETNTSYSALLDNTPDDSVPVIASGYAGPLAEALEVAFGISDGQTRLTSDADDLVKMGKTWTASPIAHENIQQVGNVEKSTVDLTFPLSDTFARTLLQPSSQSTNVTIWRGHHTDLEEEHRVVWKGRVTGPKSGGQTITVPVSSIYTTLRRHGCRVRYQRSCRHALYFEGCNLNFDDFKVAATVSAVAGVTLTVAEAALQANGWYSHGIVEFAGVKGWVTKHAGNQLVLMMPIPGLAEEVAANGSAAVFIARGCNLTLPICRTKFNNLPNFGGFPNMRQENPFSSSIV